MTNAPEDIWAVFDEDFSAQTMDVYAQVTPEGFVDKPIKYCRADLAPAVTVKPLEFSDERQLYAEVPIGTGFNCYYTIDPLEYDLEEVSFGVQCHEFGDSVIWRGPKGGGVQAANDHNRERILSTITAWTEPRSE